MIRGALHLPDGSFGVECLWELVQHALRAGAGGAASTAVVFHCMESARRGPRCARRLLTTLEALPQEQVPPIRVHVLEGGFDQWVRRFWQDGDLRIQGFDDDYWGFT